MRKISLILLAFTMVVLSACSNGQPSKPENKISVYTTVYPLEYVTQQIGGKYVTVQTIYPPGTDEHTYEPSQKDILKLADSDFFFYIGLGLEGFADKAKQVLQGQNVKMMALGDRLNVPEKNSPNVDPHVWLDPVYVKQMADMIAEQLSKKMPKQKAYFEKNYKQLAQKLDKVNAEYKAAVQKSRNKEIVVSHAAYGYWVKRYGIKQIPIAGLSTSDEPSQQQLEKVIQKVKQDHLSYIVFEKNVPSKIADVVQQETNTKPVYIHHLGVRTNKEIKEHKDYFTLVNDNLKALEKALQ
ncbi:adhesin [Weizmannia acidilactici]|uniref:Adhesin n=2 Tax=Weizmannia acidilactici TaxID=2607726 RepID=A0A5J4JG96_9BACI|nr:zinc ABC transporter substrate-binding protein [Weizmannia acidilactici]GER66507.1 adhesin [Weizmannia acidilactici]GER69348.1 adhesin [Weizmannia acidilactici]GER72325.1 adhesin [Weizmannia acidilactici]